MRDGAGPARQVVSRGPLWQTPARRRRGGKTRRPPPRRSRRSGWRVPRSAGQPNHPPKPDTGALLADREREIAIDLVGVRPDRPPLDLVGPGHQGWERNPQDQAVFLVHRPIALVDLLALGIANHDGAECRLQLLVET